MAGDPAVLERLRRHLFESIGNAGGFLSHFARPILQFDTPIGFFHQILLGHGEHAGEIDVKKGGLFPIVHGVRALALERRIEAVNSFARIEALAAAGALERDFAADLTEALQYLWSSGSGRASPRTAAAPARQAMILSAPRTSPGCSMTGCATAC